MPPAVLAGLTMALGLMPDGYAAPSLQRINNIVLVHGAFVDGGGWEPVYKLLRDKGYNVSVVQNPTVSLTADVAATKAVLAAQDGAAVLVGHSYGGVVITEAGNDPKVSALVYIAAFMPDKGESVQKLIGEPAPGAPSPPILPPINGFLTLDKAGFAASFAGDLPVQRAQFLANAQVPWGVGAFAGEITMAAWRDRPSWSLVTQDDKMIPPDAQRGMARRAKATVVESGGSHAIYESKPAVVVALIERAAMHKP